ncbi:hypothetical protein WJX84_010183 [Apatococcus fuscideae]|uniref:Uncharacterized protein n=1 Tax=Apatococcus fuscideae TaxID=2026836 RepID=A0AAW1SNM8_9CHLO
MDALAGSAGSIGFTRRAGATRQTHASIRHLLHDFPNAIPLHPHASPPETSSDGSDMVQSVGPSGKVALVFGREERHASSHPVDAAALDVLVSKWAAVIGRAGLRSEETVAGGQGNHGRKRRTAGHLRAILSRSQATKQEVQAMHGLAKAILAKLDCDAPS